MNKISSIIDILHANAHLPFHPPTVYNNKFSLTNNPSARISSTQDTLTTHFPHHPNLQPTQRHTARLAQWNKDDLTLSLSQSARAHPRPLVYIIRITPLPLPRARSRAAPTLTRALARESERPFLIKAEGSPREDSVCSLCSSMDGTGKLKVSRDRRRCVTERERVGTGDGVCV